MSITPFVIDTSLYLSHSNFRMLACDFFDSRCLHLPRQRSARENNHLAQYHGRGMIQCGICHILHENEDFCCACKIKVNRGEVCMKCQVARDIVRKHDVGVGVYYYCLWNEHKWFVCKLCGMRYEGCFLCQKCF